MITAATVAATFSDQDGRNAYSRDCIIIYDDSVRLVKLRGGPTGYESFEVREPIDPRLFGEMGGWLACFGSDRYQRCIIPGDEMLRAMREFGLVNDDGVGE